MFINTCHLLNGLRKCKHSTFKLDNLRVLECRHFLTVTNMYRLYNEDEGLLDIHAWGRSPRMCIFDDPELYSWLVLECGGVSVSYWFTQNCWMNTKPYTNPNCKNNIAKAPQKLSRITWPAHSSNYYQCRPNVTAKWYPLWVIRHSHVGLHNSNSYTHLLCTG